MKRFALILILILAASMAWGNTKDSIQVAASTDDAYRSIVLEEATVTLTDTAIMLGVTFDETPYAGAFRFINWKILRNATIDSAFFRWYASSTSTTTPVRWAFYGEDTASATTFTTADFLSRNLTTATVAESILATTMTYGYRSKDIGTVIQEIVNRADWPNDSTGDMAIMIKGDASGANKYRRVAAWDGAFSNPPMLIIYSNPPAGPADITHTIAKVSVTKTTITNEDTYSGGAGVDTVWMFYDDDATIAGADSAYDASSLGSPDTITATPLTAGTEYHCWFVISEDNGRDTSAVFHDTTMGEITHAIARCTPTTTEAVGLEDTYSGGLGVDTVWLFYDNDATIAGADSMSDATSLGSPDTLRVTGLTANTEYNFWFVISEDNGRDTSDAYTDTTLAQQGTLYDASDIVAADSLESSKTSYGVLSRYSYNMAQTSSGDLLVMALRGNLVRGQSLITSADYGATWNSTDSFICDSVNWNGAIYQFGDSSFAIGMSAVGGLTDSLKIRKIVGSTIGIVDTMATRKGSRDIPANEAKWDAMTLIGDKLLVTHTFEGGDTDSTSAWLSDGELTQTTAWTELDITGVDAPNGLRIPFKWAGGCKGGILYYNIGDNDAMYWVDTAAGFDTLTADFTGSTTNGFEYENTWIIPLVDSFGAAIWQESTNPDSNRIWFKNFKVSAAGTGGATIVNIDSTILVEEGVAKSGHVYCPTISHYDDEWGSVQPNLFAYFIRMPDTLYPADKEISWMQSKDGGISWEGIYTLYDPPNGKKIWELQSPPKIYGYDTITCPNTPQHLVHISAAWTDSATAGADLDSLFIAIDTIFIIQAFCIKGGITYVKDSLKVNASANDAQQDTAGTVVINGRCVSIGKRSAATSWHSGFRFTSVPLEKNTTIDSAFLYFLSDSAMSASTARGRYRAVNIDSSLVFAVGTPFVTGLTTAYKDTNYGSMSYTAYYKGPNIASVIQAIVNRAGWKKNNALSIVVTGGLSTTSARRTPRSYDNTQTTQGISCAGNVCGAYLLIYRHYSSSYSGYLSTKYGIELLSYKGGICYRNRR